MTKNNSFLLLGLFVFLLNCNSIMPKRLLNANAIKYSDINLFTLCGEGKLDNRIYPCFAIDSIAKNRKLVIAYFSDAIWDSATYEFCGTYWSTKHVFLADTATITIVKNNYKDKIIELQYYVDGSNARKLFSATIYQNNKRFTYNLENPSVFSPGEFDIEHFKDSLNEMTVDSFSIIDGSLKIFSANKDYLYNKITYDTACYTIKDHSIFWWISFENFIDKKEKLCR
jgi:hypothetical protein